MDALVNSGLSRTNKHSEKNSALVYRTALCCASAWRLRRARCDAWRIALVLTFTELPSLSALARPAGCHRGMGRTEGSPVRRADRIRLNSLKGAAAVTQVFILSNGWTNRYVQWKVPHSSASVD